MNNVGLSDILACPTNSLSPSHYRDDGSCYHIERRCEPVMITCSCGCGATRPDDGRCECGRPLGHD